MNPEVYFNILDEEVDNKIFDKYLPHQTSYTMSKDNTGGRPETDLPTNASTLQAKTNNTNNQPRPSTK